MEATSILPEGRCASRHMSKQQHNIHSIASHILDVAQCGEKQQSGAPCAVKLLQKCNVENTFTRTKQQYLSAPRLSCLYEQTVTLDTGLHLLLTLRSALRCRRIQQLRLLIMILHWTLDLLDLATHRRHWPGSLPLTWLEPPVLWLVSW